MSSLKHESQPPTRRRFLKTMGLAPLLLRPAPFYASGFLFGPPSNLLGIHAFAYSDMRLTPSYPTRSPLEDVLRRVAPGTDEYITEKYAFEVEALLDQWSRALRASIRDLSVMEKSLDPRIQASPLAPNQQSTLRSGGGINVVKRVFPTDLVPGRDQFLHQFRDWLGPLAQVETAEFDIFGIEIIAPAPLTLSLDIRYDIVATRT